MNYNLEIQKILLKVESSNHPEDKLNLLKQAIQIADANNDLDWGFDLRLDLIFHEKDTSHCNDSFPAFAWLLSTYDANSDLFDEKDFLWEYKWMASSARRNVNISKEQVVAIMDDLKKRMVKNGYSDRAYYSIAIDWNIFLGNIEEAKECLRLRSEAPRDRMSHCAACELDTEVELELIEGNIDQAISKAHDLISKKLTCGRVPLTTFCNLNYYLAKTGDERADHYFEEAEKEINEVDENETFIISKIQKLFYYLHKNNKDKGWEYFKKYAGWEIGSEDSLYFNFAVNVLPLLKEGGQKEIELSHKLPFYREDNIYNIADIYDHYYKKALELAKKFDERNGTDKFMKELEEVL